MPPITPPNVCGASSDPSRLARQSLRVFWSWTPFAPFLGLKSPWLDVWSPQLRALGLLNQSSYAPGMAFAGPKAPQAQTPEPAKAPAAKASAVEAPAAEAPALEAKPAKAKPAKPAKAAPAPVEVVAEAVAEAAAAPVAAPAAKKAEPKAKPAAKEPPKAAKDLFEDQDLVAALEPEALDPAPEAPAAGLVEPSLAETFSTAEAPASEPAATVQAEAQPQAAPVEALDAGDDLTLVEGVGPATARRLQEQGVRRFADLAALTPERLIEIRRVGTLTITEEQALGIISSAATLARPH